MPRQVSWQSVAIKSQPSAHGLGAVAAVAPVGTASADHASTPQKAPAAARITAAKMPSFGMRASLADMHDCTLVQSWPATQNRRHISDAREFRSEWQPRHSDLKEPTGSARRQLL